jgi:hypothetical protein
VKGWQQMINYADTVNKHFSAIITITKWIADNKFNQDEIEAILTKIERDLREVYGRKADLRSKRRDTALALSFPDTMQEQYTKLYRRKEG